MIVLRNMLVFHADAVAIQTGKVDNSGVVKFTVGEYEIANILALGTIRDKIMKITVEVIEDGKTT